MDRQSGSQLPIPVTPKSSGSPSQQPLLQFGPSQKPKRRSREGRLSWLTTGRQRSSPIWRPSTGLAPTTPQWPLPKVPINIYDADPAMTRTYTQPRDAPMPPIASSSNGERRSSSGGSSTPTLTDHRSSSPDSHHQRSQSSPPHPRSPKASSSPIRALHSGPAKPAFQTRYMNMLLSNSNIPRIHNILANLFSWMVLLAFVLAPANFAGPDGGPRSSTDDVSASGSSAASSAASSHNIPSRPLLGVCAAIFGLGMLGMAYLALCWRHNYIWLLNRIYLPLVLHSLAGLIVSVVFVQVQHEMWWSVAAYVSVAIQAASLVFAGTMFFVIDHMLLGQLKREHNRQESSKSVVDLVKAGKRPPFAPGSVV